LGKIPYGRISLKFSLPSWQLKSLRNNLRRLEFTGAGEEIRTLGPRLGNSKTAFLILIALLHYEGTNGMTGGTGNGYYY